MTNIDDYKLNLDQDPDTFIIAQGSTDAERQESLEAEKNGLWQTLRNNLKVVLPILLVLLTGIAVVFFLVMQPEPAPRRPDLTPPLTVAVYDIQAQQFQLNVQSYGTVTPRTQSMLISQVSGVVTEVSDNLREGSFFNKGDVLLKIDDRDYVADLKISEANLAEAQQAYSEEVAQSKQAEEDWARLGNTEPPSDLVLRKPQQQAAQARLASAEAALSKAQLAVDRASVVAPFDGRILSKMVDVGQVAGNNAQIAEIYATDYIEIRLPLKDSDLKFIDLPEAYRGVGEQPVATPVKIYSSLADSETPWAGSIVRTESAIDTNSRQLHVVAQIDDPFGKAAVGRAPLKIGEYVTADIKGKVIPDAIVVPATSIYQDTYAYVVEDGLIKRRNVEIIWKDEAQALVGSGLNSGDRLITTTLGQISSGTRASVEGEVTEQSTGNNRAGSQRAQNDNSASANNRAN
ncbi:MAG: efflux RND transporter periplasmic adaptor subunit [Acidiferrobacterales bacterium]|nr:efflux RND transporter periplasmic adaptor subunit [Acidiferrobacterales bacterium]